MVTGTRAFCDKPCVNKKTIALVVATYNSGAFLQKSLLANLQASFAEFIIVDGFSTDSTKDMLLDLQQNYPGRIRFFQIEKQGLAHARNFGNNQATCDLVMHAGPDNIIPESTLHAMVDALQHYNHVSCRTKLARADNYLNKAHDASKKRFSAGAQSVVGTPYIGCRTLYEEFPFDEAMLNSDDTELCQRLSRAGKTIYRADCLCLEIGFDTLATVFERWSRWGRGDALFYEKMHGDWSLQRKVKSYVHPFVAEIVESAKWLPLKDIVLYLPFLLMTCSFRYYGWYRYCRKGI